MALVLSLRAFTPDFIVRHFSLPVTTPSLSQNSFGYQDPTATNARPYSSPPLGFNPSGSSVPGHRWRSPPNPVWRPALGKFLVYKLCMGKQSYGWVFLRMRARCAVPSLDLSWAGWVDTEAIAMLSWFECWRNGSLPPASQQVCHYVPSGYVYGTVVPPERDGWTEGQE